MAYSLEHSLLAYLKQASQPNHSPLSTLICLDKQYYIDKVIMFLHLINTTLN